MINKYLIKQNESKIGENRLKGDGVCIAVGFYGPVGFNYDCAKNVCNAEKNWTQCKKQERKGYKDWMEGVYRLAI